MHSDYYSGINRRARAFIKKLDQHIRINASTKKLQTVKKILD